MGDLKENVLRDWTRSFIPLPRKIFSKCGGGGAEPGAAGRLVTCCVVVVSIQLLVVGR